jgi:mannosyltransferase OCH1-like enzyme
MRLFAISNNSSFGKPPLHVFLLSCLLASIVSLQRIGIFLSARRQNVVAVVVPNHNHELDKNVSFPQPDAHQGPIPHILWFTYRRNLLQPQDPQAYYDNVMKTIQGYFRADQKLYHDNVVKTILAYRSEWNESNAPVHFLVDSNCTDLLLELDRREHTTLAKAFAGERRGALRADLCRLAALYLHGGYYFDVDLEVVKPLQMDPNVSFSTVQDSLLGYFFQAFLAATPGHPVLRENLRTMMEYYVEKKGICFEQAKKVVGPCTLMEAWKSTSNTSHGHTRILRESHLQEHGLFPNMTQRGIKFSCNWVVDDPQEMQVYFYSRILGSRGCRT